jgi:GntR family carbon starvation induced transcriptional regulator
MLSTAHNDEGDAASPRSQATSTYETVRGDILAGRYAPGKKLKIQDLATELKVSPGAVREALSRLVPEQLVVSRDQRGFAVAPLSVADLRDLTDLRCDIEAIALRRAVERGDAHWEGQILATAHRLRVTQAQLPDGGLNPAWVVSHADFHNALVSACGSRRLLALHGQLYEQSERYRGLSAHVVSKRNVADEHQEIVDFALGRDADRLIAATIKHIRTTTDLIVESVSADGAMAR